MGQRFQTRPDLPRIARARAGYSGLALLVLMLSACNRDWLPHVDVAPAYQPPSYVVPASWHGASPFVEAKPSDGELQLDWWKLYNDPVLNKLEEQAMAANPDLQAAAERFVQARDVMMKARSARIPHVTFDFDASNNKQSAERLFRGPDEPLFDSSVAWSGIASWEPDFWSAIRNATRAEIHRAQKRAAEYGLMRLSLGAEIAEDYFTLRGVDAKGAILTQSITLYKQALSLIQAQFAGKLASALDVARVQFLLFQTEAQLAQIQGQRQVTEQAIAILLNRVPASFKIEPVDELRVPKFTIPRTLPSTLLERRPDIASMERKMAQANRAIGIARAAFYPNVTFRAFGGFEDYASNLVRLANSFWSYGSTVPEPLFIGGYRRAQLQQYWSVYRETEDRYRATVLNAFREVENNLSLTNRLTVAAERQDATVGAALKTQNLTTELFRGALASSVEVVFTLITTREARLKAVEIKAELLRASVALIRALGGGFNRKQLPADEQIQPFYTLQYTDLDKPVPAGGIDVNASNNWVNNDLTKPSAP